jgi:ATP/maltotriose-dependent transcriptional regulator MalT
MELLRRHGLDAAAGSALTSNTTVLLRLVGRWDEADGLAVEALATDIAPGQALYAHLARAELAIARGDLDLAASELGLVRSLSTEQAQQPFTVDLALAGAELALCAGDLPSARDTLLPVAAGLLESAPPRVLLQFCALGLRVQAEFTARRHRETTADAAALRVYRQLLGQCGEPGTPENRALHATCLAELARQEQREETGGWEQAVEAWQRIGHPRETAYCRLRLAEAMFAHPGHGHAATKSLRAAYRTARDLGARQLVQEAEALARRARVRLDEDRAAVTTTPAPVVFGLTARELEVLRALADGKSNREIAGDLFLSPRTVGVHVSNVLAKLGVPTRGQAAALATRLGIFADPGPIPTNKKGS